MGKYSTLTNQPLTVDVTADYVDQGWSVSGSRAVHESCNAGTITNRNLETEPGKTYKITYTVSGYSSGGIYAIMGGTQGATRTANGTYVESLTAVDNSGLKFWSDGDLAVSLIQVSDGQVDGVTVVFNEKHDRWVGNRSYTPQWSTKFLDDVFMFVNGTMWRQHDGALRNNFFGTQYHSEITFYVNVNPSEVKNFYSIRIKGNKLWFCPDIFIEPRHGKENGQKSRLAVNRFRPLQGDWFADFLRDMNDPRFTNELDALFEGALLQGGVMRITIRNNDITEARLVSVDITYDPQGYTY